MNFIVKCENIKKIYNKDMPNELIAINDIDFTIYSGEMVAIMGKSGSGKSTLMHLLGCLDYFDEGSYHLGSKQIENLSDAKRAMIRNEEIGIVMQDFALVEEFTALENVMLPLDFGKKIKGNKKEIAFKSLEQVEMLEQANQICATMSGGQKQRVAIARAIVKNPSILLADEPTGALDNQTTDNIMELFRKLNEKGMTILIITHDTNVAEKCSRCRVLQDGHLIKY